MSSRSYGTICALTKACEIIEPRWTLPILNQMWNGYSRFNDIRRAVGNISPGILSKRLADLEKAGLIERIEDRATGTIDYIRTQSAIDLENAMNALAIWAQRNIEADIALAETDVSHMMLGISRGIKTAVFPPSRVVIRFNFTDEEGPFPTYWLVAEPGAQPELCVVIPDFDIDLYVETTKLSLSAIFLGRSTVSRESEAGRLFVTGNVLLKTTMDRWLPRSVYADVEGIKSLEPAASEA